MFILIENYSGHDDYFSVTISAMGTYDDIASHISEKYNRNYKETKEIMNVLIKKEGEYEIGNYTNLYIAKRSSCKTKKKWNSLFEKIKSANTDSLTKDISIDNCPEIEGELIVSKDNYNTLFGAPYLLIYYIYNGSTLYYESWTYEPIKKMYDQISKTSLEESSELNDSIALYKIKGKIWEELETEPIYID
jgi:hypothetical protein